MKRHTLANSRSASRRGASVFSFWAVAVSLLALGACAGSLPFKYAGGSDGGGQGGATGAGGATGGGIDAGNVTLGCATSDSVLQTNCIGCHTAPAEPVFANLDLQSTGIAQRLVGVPADSGGACAGKGSLLNRGTLPATGVLIDKINFRQTCGSGMPFGATAPLAADQLACLQAWANGLVASVGN